MLIWRVINGILVVYLLLLTLRIIFSWFQRSPGGRLWELLVRVTEPYLSLFRSLRFLRPLPAAGGLDLSPIAAILVLVMALDLVGALQRFGRLTVGIFLAAATGALWSGVSFLAILYLVIVVVLIVTFRRGAGSPLVGALATLARPVVAFVGERILRTLSPRRPWGGMQTLLLTAVLLIVVLIAGRAAVALLRSALLKLPF